MKIWIAVGAFSGFLSVALGAFGAHGLAQILNEKSLSTFHTGAQYQMYHALALIGFGLFSLHFPNTVTSLPGWAFTVGTLLFSGSLYALALTQIKLLGIITPFGGISFLLGWIVFAFQALKA